MRKFFKKILATLKLLRYRFLAAQDADIDSILRTALAFVESKEKEMTEMQRRVQKLEMRIGGA